MSTRASSKASRAAKRLHEAYLELGRARAAFADATKPGDDGCFDDASHAEMRKVLRKLQPHLVKFPGVVGLAVGARTSGGVATDEVGIIVAVSRKKSPETLERRKQERLPREMRVGKRAVPIDVIEVGRFCHHGTAPAGTETDVESEEGTIGIFAVDGPTGNPVMVTAMHLTGLDAFPAGNAQAPLAKYPGGDIGPLLLGTTDGIDAAKFAVHDPNLPNNFLPGIGQVRQWRPVANPGDKGTVVRMRGVESGVVTGTILNPCYDHLASGLQGALLVEIASLPGDSGAPLVDGERCLLGFHVSGNGNGLALFSSAADTFSRLRCNL